MLSDADPQKIAHYALTSDDLAAHGARRILMSWVMSLPENTNPATAAKTLIEFYSEHRDRMKGNLQTEFVELLAEVSLADPATQTRRRVSTRRRRRGTGKPEVERIVPKK